MAKSVRVFSDVLTIIVGIGYDRDNVPMDSGAVKGKLVEFLAETFGGCTCTDSVGAWRNPGGTVVYEPSVVFTVMLGEPIGKTLLHSVVDSILEIARQSSIIAGGAGRMAEYTA